MDSLKTELQENKLKLDIIEKKLEEEIKLVQDKHDRWHKIEEEVREIVNSENKIVTINVSGEIFQSRLNTLSSMQDTLFYKIIHSKQLNLDETLYFDRDPKYFGIILDYLRYRKCNYSRLSKQEKLELKFEAEYFEIKDICDKLNEIFGELEIVKFEYSGSYTYNNQTAGTNRLDDLSDRSLQKGICAKTPGWIIFELNDEYEIEIIDIGGFGGNASLWNRENGAGATIQTSLDKITWNTVGSIPSGYGSEIMTVKLSKSQAKYLKFTSNNYLGIGYLKIKQ